MRRFVSIATLALAIGALPALGQSSNGNPGTSDTSQGPNGTNVPQTGAPLTREPDRPGTQSSDTFRNRSGATMHPTGNTAYNRPAYDGSATGKAGSSRINGTNPNARGDIGVDRNSAGTSASGSSVGVPSKGP